jgi:hypothetical protein
LDIEAATESRFDAAMAGFMTWKAAAEAAVQARVAGAQTFRAELVAKRDHLDADITELRSKLSKLRAGRLPAGHVYRVANQMIWIAVLALLGLGAADTVMQRPLVGSLFDVDVVTAFAWAAMIVVAATAISYLAGAAWSQWLYGQAKKRARRVQLAWLVAANSLAAFTIAGITVVRAATDQDTSGASLGVYLAVQAGLQAVALADGFVRQDPRLRKLRNTESRLASCETAYDDLGSHLLDVDADISVLEGFNAGVWAQNASAGLAARYLHLVKASRASRHARLLATGQRSSAEQLDLLPLPQFEVPDFGSGWPGTGTSSWLTSPFTLTIQ